MSAFWLPAEEVWRGRCGRRRTVRLITVRLKYCGDAVAVAALALVRKCVLIATANVIAAGPFLLPSPRCCVRHHAGALSPSRWRALRVRPLSRFRLASDWTGSERWD